VIFIKKTHIIIALIIFVTIALIATPSIHAQDDDISEDDSNQCDNVNNTNKTCNNKSLLPIKGNQLIYLAFGLIIILILSFIGLFYGLKRQFLKHQESLLPVPQNNHNGSDGTNDNHSPPYKEVMTKMLSPDENRVITEMINKKGPILQSQISRLPNMGKVKAHRTIKELKKKDVINVKTNGKTNEISLADEIRDMLLS